MMVAALALLAATTQADQAEQVAANATAAAVIDIADNTCMARAAGEITLPADAAGQSAFLQRARLTPGHPATPSALLNALPARERETWLTGHRQVGGDTITVVFPTNERGCALYISSPSTALSDGEEIATTRRAAGAWRDVGRERLPNTEVVVLFHRTPRNAPILFGYTVGPPINSRSEMLLFVSAPDADAQIPQGY
jgi:hypothetical protein